MKAGRGTFVPGRCSLLAFPGGACTSPHRANVCWVRRVKVAHFTDRRRDIAVEVKIGVQHAPREIVLESGQSAEEVEQIVAEALAGKSQLLPLGDEHGRRVLVPAERLAYVELGEPAPRKVGFGAL